jgi:hypothetical protein
MSQKIWKIALNQMIRILFVRVKIENILKVVESMRCNNLCRKIFKIWMSKIKFKFKQNYR